MVGSPALGVFRSRAVVVAGTGDLVLGLCLLGGGVFLLARESSQGGLSLGVILAAAGVLLLVSGLGRVTARLEVCADRVRWRWSFGWHEVAWTDLEDAALVEKGSPASGAAWAGGLVGVLFWWLAELAYGLYADEATLGPLDLVLVRRHGDPIEVKVISAWSSRASHSEANRALEALQTGIRSSAPPAAPQNRQLLHDEWEEPGSESAAQSDPETAR